MLLKEMKPKQIVRCIRGYEDANVLREGDLYEVVVVINDGADYDHNRTQGVIVHRLKDSHYIYPFVWESNRFDTLSGKPNL